MTEEEALDLAAMLDLDDAPTAEAARAAEPAGAESFDTLDGLADMTEASAATRVTDDASAMEPAAADPDRGERMESMEAHDLLQDEAPNVTAPPPETSTATHIDTDSLLGSSSPPVAPTAEAAVETEAAAALEIPAAALEETDSEASAAQTANERRRWPPWALPLAGGILGSLLAGAAAYGYFAHQLSAQGSALEAQNDKLQQLEKDNHLLQRAAEGGQEDLAKLQQALEATQRDQLNQAQATAGSAPAKLIQPEATAVPIAAAKPESAASSDPAQSAKLAHPAMPGATTSSSATTTTTSTAAATAQDSRSTGASSTMPAPESTTAPVQGTTAAPAPAPRVRLQRGGADQPRSGICDVDARDPHKSLVECIKEFNR